MSYTELKEFFIDLPSVKKRDLLSELIKRNNALLIDYLIDELSLELKKCYILREKQEAFMNIYKEYFVPNNDFRRNNIGSFIDSFRDCLSSNERTLGMVNCLLFINCSDVSTTWLNGAFIWVNNYLEEDLSLNEKIDIANRISEIYELKNLKSESISNIMKNKAFDALKKAAEKDDFIRQFKNHKDSLKSAKEIEIIEVLILAFNRDKYFYKGKFKDFENYITIVKQVLPKNQPDFWFKFFSDNNREFNKDGDIKKHSLDYLKKKFVSLIFLNQNDNHELYSKLNFDDYSIKWIEEDIREQTSREAILQTFADSFNNYTSIRNSSFWSIFRKK